DMALLPWSVWGKLALGRLIASLAFLLLGYAFRGSNRLRDAYLALVTLFAISTGFYIFSYALLHSLQLVALSSTLVIVYAFIPFIILAGLGIFPLTALEAAVLSTPVLVAEVVAGILGFDRLNLGQLIGTVWLSVLLAAIAALCSMSQLEFIIHFMHHSIRDALTGSFTRASGEELLNLQFIASSRSDTPMSIVFIDLDNFKQINDKYGHEAGDQALKAASQSLRAAIRSGDMLVRWGGEEFVVILPGATGNSAQQLLKRLLATGLWQRPDGSALTASIGIAERMLDNTENWRKLVEIADQRMYQAKMQGKNQIVPPPSLAATSVE
ncbi:MAG TPA: GGDEF domain-containing protein, partial [Methylophilaceae bacterium]|nr:GGDEF domain-containing protein [Methylophilaceae bacterium]